MPHEAHWMGRNLFSVYNEVVQTVYSSFQFSFISPSGSYVDSFNNVLRQKLLVLRLQRINKKYCKMYVSFLIYTP
jgi:hypothetical protein